MNPAVDGGVAAARGFHYQYLRTLEELVGVIEDDDATVVAAHIEGRAHCGGDQDVGEIIDYELEGTAGQRLKLVQVRSVVDPSSSRELSATQAIRVLGRLMAEGEADCYELVTNAPLTARARAVRELLDAGLYSGTELVRRLRDFAPDSIDELTGDPQNADVVERLGRCRILDDPRMSEQIRHDLSDRLRQLRARSRGGIGSDAAGLLAGYLINEVFERAAEVSGKRRISLDQFKELVFADSVFVAQALGLIDWGIPLGRVPVPPLPRIRRDTEQSRLSTMLRIDQPIRHVRRCALFGPSGIGKSSIAAAFAHEYADAYDYLLWINAEDDATLRASFEGLAHFPRDDETIRDSSSDEELRGHVHRRLAEYAGTWLAVFDNAADHHAVGPWLPRRGRGHVIITSTNSAAWSQLDRIEIGPMTQTQAIELLRDRLDVCDDATAVRRLSVLAERLERWPLALDMAAAWLVSCDRGIDELPSYIEKLTERALNDEESIPDPYPRTLVAAIDLCLERLRERVPERGVVDHPVGIALAMLSSASYLGARQIPLHLLLCCAVLDPRRKIDAGLKGPAFLEEAPFNLDEVVRVLRTQSLVERDRNEIPTSRRAENPGRQSLQAMAFDTISFNEIVQAVIRLRLESSATASRPIVERASFHVQDWLAWMVDHDDREGIELLHPHASRIVAHVERLGLQSDYVALLYGNLALSCTLRGFHEEAKSLLERELSYLGGRECPAPALELKVRERLAAARCSAGGDPETVIDDVQRALALLDEAETSPAVLAAAPVSIQHLSGLLSVLSRSGCADPRLPGLSQKLDHLGGLYAETPQIAALRDLRRATELIDAGRDGDAADVGEEVLRRPNIDALARAEGLGVLLEARAWQGRWTEACAVVDRIGRHGDEQHHFSEPILDHLLNAALACTASAAGDSQHGAVELLRKTLALGERQLTASAAPLENHRARYHLLRAVLAMLDGDRTTACQQIEQMRGKNLATATMSSTRAYDFWRGQVESWLDSACLS